MTVRDPREVERVIRRVGWEAFAFELRRSWIAWTLLIVLLVSFAYYVASPVHAVGAVRGTAVGATLPASDDNSLLMSMAIHIDGGSTVVVALPRGTLYRANARVELVVVRRDWPPTTVGYKFVRYVEYEEGAT